MVSCAAPSTFRTLEKRLGTPLENLRIARQQNTEQHIFARQIRRVQQRGDRRGENAGAPHDRQIPGGHTV